MSVIRKNIRNLALTTVFAILAGTGGLYASSHREAPFKKGFYRFTPGLPGKGKISARASSSSKNDQGMPANEKLNRKQTLFAEAVPLLSGLDLHSRKVKIKSGDELSQLHEKIHQQSMSETAIQTSPTGKPPPTHTLPKAQPNCKFH